ncbi:MAG: pilin [Parcubacteria group bacterium]|jgi:hypothetical protein
MKKNTKIISTSLIFALGIFLAVDSAMAGTIGKGGDCDTSSDCQEGLGCVSCASAGAKCLGSMCWPEGGNSTGCISQGDPCIMSNGSNGQCISWGNGAYECSSLTSSPDQNTGTTNSDYSVPDSNYNPGACPDPSKEYRDYSGNCVPYESGYEAASGGNTTGGTSAQNSNNPNLDCSSGVCFPISTNLPNPSGGVVGIITNILYWLLSIFGMLAVIAFVISGIQYIFSVGDEKAIDTAKRSMKWSIVGVVVALSGLVVLYAIGGILSATPNF